MTRMLAALGAVVVLLAASAQAAFAKQVVAAQGGPPAPGPVQELSASASATGNRSGPSAWDPRVVTGPAGPSSLTSEVYCARRGAAPTEATGSSAPNGQDSTSSTGVAACPTGLSPAAGGFAQPDSSPISFYFVYESRRVGDTWQVSGLHSGGPQAVAVDVAGYCA